MTKYWLIALFAISFHGCAGDSASSPARGSGNGGSAGSSGAGGSAGMGTGGAGMGTGGSAGMGMATDAGMPIEDAQVIYETGQGVPAT